MIHTLCPMNCHPTYCGMLVEVEGGRVTGVRGDRECPDSRGFLCIRGQAAAEVVENPRRLRTPLRRAGKRGEDRWEPVSWSVALDEIAGAMQRAGRERVGVWTGHGAVVNTLGYQLGRRFGNYFGCQWWNPTIVCWALGAYGLLLTGVVESNTKEDLGAHSNMVILWGANLASQPNTAPHVVAARRRGARVVTIDCRRTEASRASDQTILIRPGTDAALALGLMHVIIDQGLYDAEFVAAHTVGFDALRAAVRPYPPERVAAITGVPADEVVALARLYATTRPAMIVLGGSSVFKHRNGWQVARAVACLPALTGQLGIPGGGLGPRHRGVPRGVVPTDVHDDAVRPPGDYVPSHMPSMTRAFADRRIDVLLLLGTNMVSSFADSQGLESALAGVGLVAVHELFPSDTARAVADYVLPGTSWVEEVGVKWTNTHVYLMDQAIAPRWESKSMTDVLRELAVRLGLDGFFPWQSQKDLVDAILATGGYPTVAELHAQGGLAPLRVGHVAYPDRSFSTPSAKVEFYSARCLDLGLPPVPVFEEPGETPVSRPDLAARYPLVFRQGRTLDHFHSFYEHGAALPTLARTDPEPVVWLHPLDAATRGIRDRDPVELFNDRGVFTARAEVTDDILPGVVWAHDGWLGVNRLTENGACLPVAASSALPVLGGQASFEALVEVRRTTQ